MPQVRNLRGSWQFSGSIFHGTALWWAPRVFWHTKKILAQQSVDRVLRKSHQGFLWLAHANSFLCAALCRHCTSTVGIHRIDFPWLWFNYMASIVPFPPFQNDYRTQMSYFESVQCSEKSRKKFLDFVLYLVNLILVNLSISIPPQSLWSNLHFLSERN